MIAAMLHGDTSIISSFNTDSTAIYNLHGYKHHNWPLISFTFWYTDFKLQSGRQAKANTCEPKMFYLFT